MPPTDYERIAPRYDENEARHEIAPDDLIAAELASGRSPIAVLDVACGTGLWLAAQVATYGIERIRWRGIDASHAMLARARSKLAERVELVQASAEQLPFDDQSFDLVVSTFAFHHFVDKPRALDEMRRVGRTLRLRNVDPTRMRAAWMYHYFPETRFQDEKRFWSPERLVHELERRGFEVDLRIDVRVRRLTLSGILRDAERREISPLADLDDALYARGIARIKDELARDPEARVLNELAIAMWTATSTAS